MAYLQSPLGNELIFPVNGLNFWNQGGRRNIENMNDSRLTCVLDGRSLSWATNPRLEVRGNYSGWIFGDESIPRSVTEVRGQLDQSRAASMNVHRGSFRSKISQDLDSCNMD
jgi:hypothetical protein